MYTRFYKNVDGKKQFNPWSLISPVQIESQKMISDTSDFSTAIQYPIAPKFQCVAPDDTTAEAYVAEQIAKMITDSVNSIMLRTTFDYDGTMAAVRKNAAPDTRMIKTPKVKVSLVGTASPEALKYGFMNSIQPGNFESENAELAGQRADRTSSILGDKLSVRGIQNWEIGASIKEVQFSEPVDSLEAIKRLPSMRYVSADVTIPINKLEITPVTVPILLPLWLALLTLLLVWLLSRTATTEAKSEEPIKAVMSEKRSVESNQSFDWRKFFLFLVMAVCCAIVAYACYYFAGLFLVIMAYVLFFVSVYCILYLILYLLRFATWRDLWNPIHRFFKCLVETISSMFFWGILISLIWVSELIDWFHNCDCKCFIWKLLLAISVIINILFFLHWKGLWPF